MVNWPASLFAFDEGFHAEFGSHRRGFRLMGAARRGYKEDACFVVCCAAAVEAVAPAGGDEGFSVPEVEVAGGRTSRWGVEQDGGVAFGGGGRR